MSILSDSITKSCALTAAFWGFCGIAQAQTFPDDIARNSTVLFCTDNSGTAHHVYLLRTSVLGYRLFPDDIDAMELGGLITAHRLGWVLSIGGQNYSLTTKDAVEVGTCEDVTATVADMINLTASDAPDAFKAFATDVVVPSAEWRAAQEKAMKDARDQIYELQAQVWDMQSDLKKAQADLVAAQAEARKADQAPAQVVANLNKANKQIEDLKAQICRLNPKATFSICKTLDAAP